MTEPNESLDLIGDAIADLAATLAVGPLADDPTTLADRAAAQARALDAIALTLGRPPESKGVPAPRVLWLVQQAAAIERLCATQDLVVALGRMVDRVVEADESLAPDCARLVEQLDGFADGVVRLIAFIGDRIATTGTEWET